jgi:hypothetical protein
VDNERFVVAFEQKSEKKELLNFIKRLPLSVLSNQTNFGFLNNFRNSWD